MSPLRPLVLIATLVAMCLPACAGDGASRAVAPSTGSGGGVTAAGAQRAVHPGGVVRDVAPNCDGASPGPFAFIGGTDGNVAAGTAAFVGSGGGNESCSGSATIAGGFDNVISAGSSGVHDFIGGGEDNSITDGGLDDVIAGGFDNAISNVAVRALIGGGYENQLNGSYSSILGGWQSTIATTAQYAVINGGYNNKVTAEYGAIDAGLNNTVSGEGGYIAAGGYNNASGEGSVVDGGFNQTASGTFSTIPGGYENSAAGTYTFAAGARAGAPYTGDFVWSDGSNGSTLLNATKAYEFLARASGGVVFYTNAAATVGASLAAGSGTWASLSDRNAKTGIVALDGAAVLDKLDTVPISRWSYRTEHGVRHVGPMAQDFYAAFKVGPDDRHITSIDEDGVALAAIKALHADNRALHAENAQLRSQLRAMQAEIELLRAR